VIAVRGPRRTAAPLGATWSRRASAAVHAG
jgi:hypothetical protein